ncbi:putative PB1 domain-containing protein [Helianthus anomalus]
MAAPALKKHNSTTTTIKFLCSYGGKILPRYPDGKLRYHGGQTRVLVVDHPISFSELLVKLGELRGTTSTLRCQLPTEELDALVFVTFDEDRVNLIEEYDHQSTRQSKSLKIRAFLSLLKRSYLSPSPSRSTVSGSSSFVSTTTHDAGSLKSPLSSVARSPHLSGFKAAGAVQQIR